MNFLFTDILTAKYLTENICQVFEKATQSLAIL